MRAAFFETNFDATPELICLHPRELEAYVKTELAAVRIEACMKSATAFGLVRAEDRERVWRCFEDPD